MSTKPAWRCPNCQQALNDYGNYWQCANRHTFDVSKEGYVNLLLSSQKRSKEPGDNKNMVLARRLFLESGHYSPLVEGITDMISEHAKSTSSGNAKNLLDLGCGEGFYLQQIMRTLEETLLHYQGIDISKAAIQKAAKRKINAEFAVASTYQIPSMNNDQDVVLQIFAPSDIKEVKRALKPEGIWLLVQPGPEHLFEMKQMVYDSPSLHSLQQIAEPSLQVIEQRSVNFQFNLTDKQQRLALLEMTPFYWTISESKKQRLLENLTSTTADFVLTVLKKSA